VFTALRVPREGRSGSRLLTTNIDYGYILHRGQEDWGTCRYLLACSNLLSEAARSADTRDRVMNDLRWKAGMTKGLVCTFTRAMIGIQKNIYIQDPNSFVTNRALSALSAHCKAVLERRLHEDRCNAITYAAYLQIILLLLVFTIFPRRAGVSEP
jgi:hypothetical protein